MQTIDRPCSFDSEIKFKCPADFVPRLHAYSRSRGLTTSALIRLLVIDEMERARFQDEREAA